MYVFEINRLSGIVILDTIVTMYSKCIPMYHVASHYESYVALKLYGCLLLACCKLNSAVLYSV